MHIKHGGLQLSQLNCHDAHRPHVTPFVVAPFQFHSCHFRGHPRTEGGGLYLTFRLTTPSRPSSVPLGTLWGLFQPANQVYQDKSLQARISLSLPGSPTPLADGTMLLDAFVPEKGTGYVCGKRHTQWSPLVSLMNFGRDSETGVPSDLPPFSLASRSSDTHRANEWVLFTSKGCQ